MSNGKELVHAIISERMRGRAWSQSLITNKISDMSFQFMHRWMTLNDLEQSKRICNSLAAKSKLHQLGSQRSAHISN